MVASMKGRELGNRERPLLEAFTKQRDWEYKSLCESDLWSVVTSCKSVQ
jgi:hypothetical protein